LKERSKITGTGKKDTDKKDALLAKVSQARSELNVLIAKMAALDAKLKEFEENLPKMPEVKEKEKQLHGQSVKFIGLWRAYLQKF
jgi:hypothetical protein